MSHELRTPLNSSLILAKLLADNTHGNLTEEQVKFAQTISSAGNDLLALINDILDLSKIEAGKVELAAGAGRARARCVDDLRAAFEPLAQREGPRASPSTVEPGAPRAHRDRRAAARPDPARTCSPTRSSSPSAARSRCASSRGAGRHGRASRCTTPASAFRRAPAGDHLRGVPPGRRQHAPQVRRHRARAVDLARPGAPARRRHHGRRATPGRAARSR